MDGLGRFNISMSMYFVLICMPKKKRAREKKWNENHKMYALDTHFIYTLHIDLWALFFGSYFVIYFFNSDSPLLCIRKGRKIGNCNWKSSNYHIVTENKTYTKGTIKRMLLRNSIFYVECYNSINSLVGLFWQTVADWKLWK